MNKNFSAGGRYIVLLAAACMIFNFRADAALATVWHIPDNTTTSVSTCAIPNLKSGRTLPSPFTPASGSCGSPEHTA